MNEIDRILRSSGDIRAHALKHCAGGDMFCFIVLNGRSATKIVANTRKVFGEDIDLIVVTHNLETLHAPGEVLIPASAFEPKTTTSYVLITNGGTSFLLVPVLLRLERSSVSYKVVDLQRDGGELLDERL